MFTGTVVWCWCGDPGARSKLVASGRRDHRHQRRPGQAHRDAGRAASCSARWPIEGIFLSSACGGGGTCGQCKCQVLKAAATLCRPRRRSSPPGDPRRLAAVLPGGGQAGHEDPGARRRSSASSAGSAPCSNPNVATFIKELVLKLPRTSRCRLPRRRLRAARGAALPVRYKPISTSPEYREDWEKFGLFDLELDKVDRADDPRLLDGQLPGGEGHAEVQHPHRLAAARRQGRAAGHRRPTSSTSSRATRSRCSAPSASSSPRRPTTRWSSSAAAPAWRRCARTSSTSSSG
jgi:hypothetical protein